MSNYSEALVARRIRKGYTADSSYTLLREITEKHSGDNLVHALVYNDFATEKQAERFAEQRELIAERVLVYRESSVMFSNAPLGSKEGDIAWDNMEKIIKDSKKDGTIVEVAYQLNIRY